MIISGSPDLSVLEIKVTWDISGVNPLISLVNESAGSGLANLSWWVITESPTQTLIHEGSELTPDITGAWSNYLLTSNWPRPFNQTEFSGAPYALTLYVKDSAGNIYSITKSATICRPPGNTNLSKNPYGLAKLNLQVKCNEAGIFFQDTTNHSYRGLDGDLISSTLKVVYPIDETGSIPDPFINTNFSSVLVPISYSSDNYQYVQDSVYDYDFGDNVHIRIKYQSRSKNGAFAISFPVLCNIDLCPLVCEVTALIESIEDGNCGDVEDANRKLSLINPKLLLVQIGKQEPLCGIDVPELIEEIKAIGGFTCDCCNANTGIIPQTSAVIGGYTFEINPVCGDITGSISPVGNVITFNLQDKSYVFDIHTTSPQDITAFTVLPSTNGCTKIYSLQVDGPLLAGQLLNIIAIDGDLVNLFNSIVLNSGSNFQLIVDGGCIFQSTSTCDYALDLQGIPVNATFALLSGIKIGSTNHSLSFAFNLTNLPALQTYLNGLGYGTFTVTNPIGQQVSITSNANPNDIQSLSYKISATTFLAGLQKDCTGYVAIDANEVVQNIIDYLCNLDDSQVVTSQEYVINFINSLGEEESITIPEGNTLATLLAALIQSGNTTVDNLGNLVGVSCDAMKANFPSNTLQITNNDFIFATKGNGSCSRVAYIDIFNYMLQVGFSNATTKQLFCDFVVSCGAGLNCAPYNFLEAIVTEFNSSCVPLVGIDFTLS